MQVWTEPAKTQQQDRPTYIHSINEDWHIYLSEDCQLLKKMMQMGWIFDFIAAYQLHPDVKYLKVQKWVLRYDGYKPALMCFTKKGKMVLRLEIGEDGQFINNTVIWVTGLLAMTTKEYRRYGK